MASGSSMAQKLTLLMCIITSMAILAPLASMVLKSALQPIQIKRLDHFVITVKDLDATVNFYTRVLGMEVATFKGGRKSLHFGNQKINIHVQGNEFEPKSKWPTPGSADVCFITDTQLNDVMKHLKVCNISIEEGPVDRTGAIGSISSVYVRDPDHNLIEISNYPEDIEPRS